MTRSVWMLALLVALVTAAAFAPGLTGGFVWDDDANLVRNTAWRGLGSGQLRWMATSFHLGHWQPLTWLSFAVDYSLWGLNPTAFRATNLGLHALGAVLLFGVARRLLKDDAAAALAALLWAVHPLRVESVTWITERRDVLSAALLLLATWAYLRAIDDARWWALLVPAYALSLCAKAWGVTFPVVAMLLDAALRRGVGRRVVGEKLALLAIALPVLLIAPKAQQAATAMSTWAGHPLPHRLAIAAYGSVWYPLATLAPVNLSPLYEIEPAVQPLSAEYVGALLGGLAITAAAVVLARRGRPEPLLAWLAYLVIVAPVLGVFQSGVQKVADRYAHLSTIPFALLAGALLARWRAAGAALVVVLAAATAWQTRHWHDEASLWARVVAVQPDSAFGRHNAGQLAYRAGRLDEARAQLTRAIELADHLPRSYLARAMVELRARRLHQAAADVNRALQRSPDDASAHYWAGLIRRELGDRRGALRHLRRATALSPRSWLAWGAYGRELADAGRRPAARVALRRALELAPAGPRAEIAEQLRALGR